MKKNYCICCQNERNGLEIQEDGVIRTIRQVKKALGMKTNQNGLVWCKDCYTTHTHLKINDEEIDTAPFSPGDAMPKGAVKVDGYEERRKRYESRQVTYVALGVVFGILGLIVSGNITTVFTAIVLIVFLYALSLLAYTPKIKIGAKR